MKRSLLATGFIAFMMLAGSCEKDPSPVVCRPDVLRVGTDSINFVYDDQKRVSLMNYYDVFRHKAKVDEFAYDAEGRLVTITKKVFPLSAAGFVDVVYTLQYDDEDRPSKLTSVASFSQVTTDFTHDDQGRLLTASTHSGDDFVGATRYEYNDAGNIVKVFYTLNLNQRIQEVLARENFTFDDKEKFYVNVPELKVCNEYVYAYLPNKNNCLTAKVYYYTYHQRFANPLSVSFQALYDEEGQITSLQSAGATTQLFSGDVLFEGVRYLCN